MQLVIHTNEALRQELLINGIKEDVEIISVKNAEEFTGWKDADGFIDLLFDYSKDRIDLLLTLSPKPVVVNSVVVTLQTMNASFVRFNGWPGFLDRHSIEASVTNDKMKQQAVEIFSCLNKDVCWIDDIPGLISARVIAMIINEAWFALQEDVSTKQEIDLAMKLGTNYPYGPFEWCNKIGIDNIYSLLHELSKSNPRYEPAALLQKEALSNVAHFKY